MTHPQTPNFRFLLSATVALMGLALLLPASALAQDRPDLSGTWYFSAGESDDPQEKLGQQAIEMGLTFPLGPPPGEGSNRPGADATDGPPKQGGPSAEQRGRLRTTREKLEELFRAQEAFELLHSDTSLTWNSRSVEDESLHLRIGQTVERMDEDLGEIKTKASWADERMRVQRKIKDGPTVKEYYTLSTDRSRLLVDLVIDGGGIPGKFEFRRIYTRTRPR